MVILGATQPAVGTGSGAGAGAVAAAYFLHAMADLGRKVVVDKVDRESVDVEFHREDENGAMEGRGVYNHMYSSKEYCEKERGRMDTYLETTSTTVS